MDVQQSFQESKRERQDGPVDHLRVIAKSHVLVPETVGEQKIFVLQGMGGAVMENNGHKARTAA